MDDWLKTKPKVIQQLATKYPPGTKFQTPDGDVFVISYFEDGIVFKLTRRTKMGDEDVIDQIDEWLRITRQKLTVREIQSLREIGYNATREVNGLKNKQEENHDK